MLISRDSLLSFVKEVDKKSGHRMAIYRCECGNEKVIRINHVKNGKTLSCGCLRDKIISYERTGLDHKVSESKLYKKWISMKARCGNPNDSSYMYYGGKGIKVCNEWLIYKNFKEWADSSGYRPELTIDRIDSCGNYCPSNCRWVSKSDNTSYMLDYHYNNQTGQFTDKVLEKITSVNRKKLGRSLCLVNGDIVIAFECLHDAAIFIIESKNLTTSVSSIKKNISACLHGKRKKCHGFSVEHVKSSC